MSSASRWGYEPASTSDRAAGSQGTLETGFILIRTKGSHHFVRHPDGRATVVPVHASETLGPGLFNRILKDAEIERDEFDELL